MNTVQIKADLHRYVEQADNDFLEIVHVMFGKHFQQQHEYVGEPITPEELSKQCMEAVEDVQNGNFYTVEEARKMLEA